MLSYSRPEQHGYLVQGDRRHERYFTLPFEYWTAEPRCYTTLSLPAKVMLSVGSTLAPGCVLRTEKTCDWYGVSTEIAERGFRMLREVGLLDRKTTVKDRRPALPAGPGVPVCALPAPFGRQRRTKLTVISSATS